MPPRTDDTDVESEPRIPLSRVRVLRAAVARADREGLDALTMRGLARELDVEAMSLYHHVANKEAVLDGVVEVIVDEISDAVAGLDAPSPATDWREAMRARILAARDVLLRHPWAPRVIETRSAMSPTVIGYMDGIVGVLLEGGFSPDLAHHAMHALGSRAMGFTQELFDPGDDTGSDDSLAMLEEIGAQFPNLVTMLSEVAHDPDDPTLGWCDDQTEFEFGLDVLLDGLERRRAPD